MFTQPCFIRKYTPQLIQMLENIGIKKHPSIMLIYRQENLYVNRGFYSNYPIGYQEEIEMSIDCGTNEQLFLAISSLRNDTDKNQWFTDGVNWVLCDEFKFSSYWVYNDINISLDTIHKATVEELIEHFKDK